ncbi:phospholipase A2-like [Plodia interpunctella]|uniref:phospholipase A2-like n=1 Tax=Plodia interpunctella TaxID=58824 RepID=UPI00236856D0|nr:phospholipase A2-like [Plodia interpunctella]
MRSIAMFSVVLLKIIDLSNCWVFTDVNYVKLARMVDHDEDMQLTDDELRKLKFSLIYPGTKWCGPGNVADDFDDLGVAKDTDMCCRAHDNCPGVIPAGETKFNLTNEAFYSRLSCECDEEFRQCLHKVDSKVSSQIGSIYFNALGQECYRKDYPIKSCRKRGGWLSRKCLEYEYDKNGEQKYQWFYVPNY